MLYIDFDKYPAFFTKQDKNRAMNLYIECLEYDIEWSFKTNLFYSHGKKDMFKRVKKLQNKISKSRGMKKGC